jgi:hypothetical protein
LRATTIKSSIPSPIISTLSTPITGVIKSDLIVGCPQRLKNQNLFLPWSSLKIADLALNNNHSFNVNGVSSILLIIAWDQVMKIF